MSDFPIKTPVALIVFKRPNTTERVFKAIRKVKPQKLFLIADGPRVDRPGEAEKCAATRSRIARVDWKCEVLKNYSEINLGCGNRLPTGLDWVFDQVEEAIILEDDCVPQPTFFRFCEELLARYRDDERIASISGQNVQFGRKRTDYSYYFSCYNHNWGWATWKRAWHYYDFDMNLWPEIHDRNFLRDILGDSQAGNYWTDIIQARYEGNFNTTWDVQWTFACWIHNRLGILSNVNLISNIGFGSESTHTSMKESQYANMLTEAMEFPLKHPPFMIPDKQADNFTQKTFFKRSSLQRLKTKLKKFL